MTSKLTFCTASVFAFALFATGFAGCGGNDLVKGSALPDKRTQSLSIGTVMSVNGSYEDNKCLDPAASGALRSGAVWSANISNSTGSDPLVVLNDSGCKLDLASVVVQDSLGASQTALAASSFQLSASYGAPVLFSYTDSGTSKVMQFYGNAKLTPADFSSNFVLLFVYSDTLDGASMISLTGQYATVSTSAAQDSQVAAPNDVLSLAAVTYTKDAQNIVQSIAGSLSFTLGGVPGDKYVIVDGACPATLAAADTAYQGGTQVSVNTAPSIADFGLSVSVDLTTPLEKCMIVGKCDTSSVCSFQMSDVIFN